jgi:IMP dehydrogenase
MSAAMDTVTEAEMALAMAKMGCLGILHRNLSVERQVEMVKWIRRQIHSGGKIEHPICFSDGDHLSHLETRVKEHGWTFTSFPILNKQRKFLGLITRDELDFTADDNPPLVALCRPLSRIITAPHTTTIEEAYQIMIAKRVKKLPLLDADGVFQGMYVWNDVKHYRRQRDDFSLDEDGHFLVGAAIGVGQAELDRAKALIAAGCRILVIDSSHGACAAAKDIVVGLKKEYGDRVQLIVGNMASYASAKYLLQGPYIPDALKVGIGPGSICTTRRVTGHGVPQVTAIYEVWRAVRESSIPIPIIADGGIRSSGDIVKCLACGASSVMLGSLLAGASESPGAVVIRQGKSYKTIRGMGSRSAMAERSGSRNRYHMDIAPLQGRHRSCGRTPEVATPQETLTQVQQNKVVPEGVEGLVELKGSLENILQELLGGVRAGLAHSGCRTIAEFQQRARIWVQSVAGILEGQPHDIHEVRE